MIALFSVNSVEFYTLAAVMAAGIVALFIRPAVHGEALTYLLSGTLGRTIASEPGIRMECRDDNSVILTRYGLPVTIGSDGAASLAITLTGNDMIIEERLTAGQGDPSYDTATFILDFLTPGRYHVLYRNSAYGLAASASLTVKPDIVVERKLL